MRYDESGPAFPIPGDQHDECFNGMSLRDYFAAKAMPGLLSLCQHDSHEGKSYIEYVAGLSYGMADAMMKARTQEGEKP